MSWWSSNVTDKVSDVVHGAEDAASEIWSDISGETASDAALEAANIQAGSQGDQLDYLKQINKMPQQYKEQALAKLNDIYSGGDDAYKAQSQMIDQAKQMPMYKEMMGYGEAGEDTIMRNAGMTGGLRSGNVQHNLVDYNTQLQNQALSGSYNQLMGGLQGLAGLPTNESQIGQVYGDVGSTRAAGILGSAAGQQAGTQSLMNMGLGLGGMYFQNQANQPPQQAQGGGVMDWLTGLF